MGKSSGLGAKCEDLLQIIENKNSVCLDKCFHVLFSEKDGSRKLLFENFNDGVVSYADEQALVTSILLLARNYKPLKGLTHSQAVQASKYLKSTMKPLDKTPPLLRFKSESGLCFHRIGFDPKYDENKTPIFDEFINRTSNSNALMAFIGSLFFPDSDRSQWCWIHGKGLNGKGALVRMLQRIMNGCYASEETPTKGNRFWTSGLLGKRLVAFADCDTVEFPSSGFFRSLTGNDFIRIEEKGQSPFNIQLDCKFLFLSNDYPILDDNLADLRRAIFSHSDPIDQITPNYEEKLWAEAPWIIGKCMEAYSDSLMAGPTIEVEKSSFDQITSVKRDSLQAIFDQHFTYCLVPNLPAKDQDYLTGPEVQHLLKNNAMIKNIADRSRFLAFLEDRYSLKSKTFRDKKNDVLRGFVGLKSRHYDFNRGEQNTNNILKLKP